ncbi:MAG: guanylate kinase [Coriobacteriia bacterium]|nr:guanylate kinase [Coriobacteriia bacterium]
MSIMSGKLFVVSGPSGAGKGTLLAQVIPGLGNIHVAVSVTTRQPRLGEIDGVDYFFFDDCQFDEQIASGGLLEWAAIHQARYGTLRSEVLDAHAQGLDVVLEIDPQGARQVKAAFPEAVLIFIEPPSIEELRRRLYERGTESEAAIEERIKTAVKELETKPEYDKVILNDDLEAAAQELSLYMQGIVD